MVATDKPVDIIGKRPSETQDIPQQSEEVTRLAMRVQDLFRSAWDAKQQLGLTELWRRCDDYVQNRQNPKQSHEHPGSVTNIIRPIIESQISDLVDKPFNVAAKGWEPSDDMYAEQTQNIMDFILYCNKFPTKMNVSEHDRLELGTSILKVWFDEDALEGRGLPMFDPVSPANFFPDPKIPRADLLQDAEFIIHAVPRPLSWIRKQFPQWGKYVNREVAVPYDPEDTFTDAQSDTVSPLSSERALLLECYMKDDKGELYCVHVANHLVLEDSRKTLKDKKLQRRDKYPFVMIPDYLKRGTAWGMGDVEMLIPTQDLINELDDQIRMNARLAGNPQVVVGFGAGKNFPFHKWTNKPGLRIPMRDQNAWNIVPPQNVSSDVLMRREKAFEEADTISGRSDVTRGEKPGQVTAAAAILALQQAGQKGVIHKAKMFKEAWPDVLALLYDEMIENWDEEMWIRINGDKPDYQFVDPSELRNVPIRIPNDVEGEEGLVELTDQEFDPDTGELIDEKVMTRDAQYDFQLNIGDGLPTDKAFVYQSMLDLLGAGVVSPVEMREYLRNNIGFPLDPDNDPEEPQQQPGMPPEQAMMPPGMDPNAMVQQGVPPEMMQPEQMAPAPPPLDLSQIPPEVLQQALAAMEQAGIPIPGAEQGGVPIEPY